MFHVICSDMIIPFYYQGIVKLIIQRYTREAGVRNLERNLAALARAAAVRVAEQEKFSTAIHLRKGIQTMAASTTALLDTRLAGAGNRSSPSTGDVEMEVIPMDVSGQEISSFDSSSPIVVDETMLEKVLGVKIFRLLKI
jgi:ATP-dependent Lon protease